FFLYTAYLLAFLHTLNQTSNSKQKHVKSHVLSCRLFLHFETKQNLQPKKKLQCIHSNNHLIHLNDLYYSLCMRLDTLNLPTSFHLLKKCKT
ncbi:hypothetical protein VIGAN_04202800, partial [Vigna angularis var. angularis]